MPSPKRIADRISSISFSSTAVVATAASRMRSEGVDIVDFGAGEPDFPTPANVKRAAIEALERNFTKYTDTGGTPELKRAICERHALDFGTAYEPAECIVSVGGKHVVFNLVQALVNPGDEVLIPVPYWVTYLDVVNYAGGHPVLVPIDEANGFAVTAAAIEPYLTARTRMVILNSPNNPSGAVADREELARIFRMTSSRGIYLLSDECYCQFVFEGSPFSVASLPGAKESVLVVGSVSKTYAMTGWRIGFGLAPREVALAMLKLQSHTTSNPTSIAQAAALEALSGPQDAVFAMLEEYRRRRRFVLDRLRSIPGVNCPEPHGAFYAFPNIADVLDGRGPRTSMEFARALLEKAWVATVPGEAFGTRSHIRISYATSMRELERGLGRIDRFIQTGEGCQ